MLETVALEAELLLGDQAAARGAIDAGITAAYAYPGTPSTEILESIQALAGDDGPLAQWCANEKTAYEAALGVSLAGRRALVAMKHVGLNVAADPFMNSAVVAPRGGLVLAVADDPGMHSSQNEQDSRFYADFAGIPCLEPATPQEVYDMTREAFEVSEQFRIPVMLRLVTRLAHQRAAVEARPPRAPRAAEGSREREEWVLLPSFARRRWRRRIEQRPSIAAWSESSPHSELKLGGSHSSAVITCGLARSYFLEAARELRAMPPHLHIGAYPIPVEKIRRLIDRGGEVLVLEDGYPLVERALRGILPSGVTVFGRMSGQVPPDGELSQDIVRSALGLPVDPGISQPALPARPPRLCDGCPHIDTYKALSEALATFDNPLVTSDIGCYTLGALPPWNTGDSCVCMGASIGMARGASQAGLIPAVALIGDSTFLHSGITPLIDAAAHDANLTVVILDNETVAMTGAQPALVPSSRLEAIVRATGVAPEHCHTFEVHPRTVPALAALLRSEIEHPGLSVVIAQRACIEAARKSRAAMPSRPDKQQPPKEVS